VIFRIADDLDAAATLRNQIAFRNRVDRVIGALGLNVRANLADDRAHVELRENHYCIDVSERGYKLASDPKVTLPTDEGAIEKLISGGSDLDYTMAVEIVPPTVATLTVQGSWPRTRPCGFNWRFTSPRTEPL